MTGKRLLAIMLLALPFAFAQERIVSLNGDITEIIFALGAHERLVAIDATSNWPEATSELANVGYHGQLSAEAIMVYSPDVVIATPVAGPPEVLEQIEQAGIPVHVIANDPDLYTPVSNIRTVAALIGEAERGEELALEVQARIEEAANYGAQLERQPRVMFLYLGSTQMQFAGGIGSTSNAMIEGVGAIDAGAEAGFRGFQPFSAEALIGAAPDVLIVTERGLAVTGGLDGVLEIPGVRLTPAGLNRAVLVFEDLYFIGMGPRTGDALMELAERLRELQ